jgi:putative cell wall-binding protein
MVPLAKKYGAPVLFTETAALSSDTKAEIQRLKPSKVFILGGTGAVSDAVKIELEGMGIIVERLGGLDRYETAALIAGKLAKLGCKGKAIVVNAWNYPDALAISPWAASNDAPILLTDVDGLPSATKAALAKLQVTETYVAGGIGVVNDEVLGLLKGAKRYSGSGRYETGVDIVSKLFKNYDTIFVATGEDYHDALAASVLAAEKNCPIILANNDYALQTIEAYLKGSKNKVKTIYAITTGDAINGATTDMIKNLVMPQ